MFIGYLLIENYIFVSCYLLADVNSLSLSLLFNLSAVLSMQTFYAAMCSVPLDKAFWANTACNAAAAVMMTVMYVSLRTILARREEKDPQRAGKEQHEQE